MKRIKKKSLHLHTLKRLYQKGAPKSMANKKEIIRDEYIRIKMSKQEKKLFTEYANGLGERATQLARALLMIQALKDTGNITEETIAEMNRYLEISKNEYYLDEIRNKI